MKFLKWTSLVLFAAVLAFLAAGFLFPALDYQSTAMIERPREQTWGIFADERNMPKWIPGFKSLERISGQPHEVGSTYRMTVEEEGKEYSFTETTTAYTPPERYAFHLDAGILTNDVDIRFIDHGGRTEIVAKSHVVGSNPIWRSLFCFTKSVFARKDQDSYDRLKRLVEEAGK